MTTGEEAPGLVIVSPLPPSPSGIAAYTAELLPALAEARRLTVVVATEEHAAAARAAAPPARVIGEAAWRADPALQAQPHLHQLGNSLDHAHVYRAALRRPGVVALHDVVLHHLVEAMTLGRGSPHAYAAALAREHGPAGRRLAALRRLGLFQPAQRFLMPLHGAVLERSLGVVVHSRFAAARLRRPGGRPEGWPERRPGSVREGLPVRILPHHLSPAVARFEGVTPAAARARLGLPAAGPVLLALGHVTPAKQVGTILQALALLRAQGQAPLLVVGGAVEAGLGLAEQVASLGLEDQVRLTGWLEEEAFFLHLRAADLLLALRFPLGGESSGTLARALGMGTPALAYDVGPAAEYPDAILAKLPFTAWPAPAVAAAIAAELASPEARVARGAASRLWMREHCVASASAEAYAACLDAWAG